MPNNHETADRGTERKTVRAPRTDDRFSRPLRGIDVDPDTRCAHYHGTRDVIALRFACCDVYYPCFKCHRAATDHEAEQWNWEQQDEPVVLCGCCGTTMTAASYLRCDYECPHCGARFNPGCRGHWERYFAFSVDELLR